VANGDDHRCIQDARSEISSVLRGAILSPVLTQSDKQPPVQHGKHQGLDLQATGPSGEVLAIVLKDLSFALFGAAEALQQTALVNGDPINRVEQGIDFYREVNRLKISLIRTALAHANSNQKRAAKLLGIRLSTLNAMIKRFGLKPITASKKM